MEVQKEEIEYYLSLLGEQLKELGQRKPIRILMIGGGFMLTQVDMRRTTNDIDVKVLNIDDPQHSRDYLTFRNAVRFVAYDAHIRENWLSDTIGDFLTIAGPVPKGKWWKKFGPLEVRVPPVDFILAHKLLAGRDKDTEDIKMLFSILHIENRKQAQKIVDKYVKGKDFQDFHNLQGTLDAFFPT